MIIKFFGLFECSTALVLFQKNNDQKVEKILKSNKLELTSHGEVSAKVEDVGPPIVRFGLVSEE